MSAALAPELLHDLAKAIAQRTGLHFPDERRSDLERGLRAAATMLALGDPAAWARRIVAGQLAPREREVLIDRLTIGETYFRREPAAFAALEQEILPRLLAARAGTTRALNLWSAGCCTGEEAYSLAITCMRVIPDLPTWRVTVLGTDVNEKSLAKARRGVYGTWSFRGVPDWLRPRHFSHVSGQTWEIGERERGLVRFATHNLAADAFPPPAVSGPVDVIFCRNVIMYLTPDHQRDVFASLHAALADDGVLVLSPAEGGFLLREWFEVEQIGDAIVYRKAGDAAKAPVRRARAATTPSRPGPTRPATAVDPGAPGGVPARPAAPAAPAPIAAPAALIAPAAPAVLIAPAAPAALIAPAAPAAPAPIATQPLAAPDLLARARAQADEGRLEAAIPTCQEAIALNPGCVRAAFLLATIHQDLGRHDEEAAALRRVLEIDAGFALAHRALGDLERRRGRPAEARRHFRHALAALAAMDKSDMVPESDGITAGRLAEAITKMLSA